MASHLEQHFLIHHMQPIHIQELTIKYCNNELKSKILKRKKKTKRIYLAARVVREILTDVIHISIEG